MGVAQRFCGPLCRRSARASPENARITVRFVNQTLTRPPDESVLSPDRCWFRGVNSTRKRGTIDFPPRRGNNYSVASPCATGKYTIDFHAFKSKIQRYGNAQMREIRKYFSLTLLSQLRSLKADAAFYDPRILYARNYYFIVTR